MPRITDQLDRRGPSSVDELLNTTAIPTPTDVEVAEADAAEGNTVDEVIKPDGRPSSPRPRMKPAASPHSARAPPAATDPDGDPRPQRLPRWALRREALVYGRIGPTRFNELTHAKKIRAKKDGTKVIVDLNSIDDYYETLPEVGDEVARNTAAGTSGSTSEANNHRAA